MDHFVPTCPTTVLFICLPFHDDDDDYDDDDDNTIDNNSNNNNTDDGDDKVDEEVKGDINTNCTESRRFPFVCLSFNLLTAQRTVFNTRMATHCLAPWCEEIAQPSLLTKFKSPLFQSVRRLKPLTNKEMEETGIPEKTPNKPQKMPHSKTRKFKLRTRIFVFFFFFVLSYSSGVDFFWGGGGGDFCVHNRVSIQL